MILINGFVVIDLVLCVVVLFVDWFGLCFVGDLLVMVEIVDLLIDVYEIDI